MRKIICVPLLIFAFLSNNFHVTPSIAAVIEKYPDNSEVNFKNADSFYESLDKNQYAEYKNAKLNIREKTYFKDINKFLSKADQYGQPRVGGNGYNPNRQVYVFATVSNDGMKMKTAVYDAENQRQIAASSPLPL